MTSATSQAVIFELRQGGLTVSKESAELGSAREELAASVSGEPLTVAFNPGFWLDVLKTLADDEVRVELAGADRPGVIRQPAFLYLALPMRVS